MFVCRDIDGISVGLLWELFSHFCEVVEHNLLGLNRDYLTSNWQNWMHVEWVHCGISFFAIKSTSFSIKRWTLPKYLRSEVTGQAEASDYGCLTKVDLVKLKRTRRYIATIYRVIDG